MRSLLHCSLHQVQTSLPLKPGLSSMSRCAVHSQKYLYKIEDGLEGIIQYFPFPPPPPLKTCNQGRNEVVSRLQPGLRVRRMEERVGNWKPITFNFPLSDFPSPTTYYFIKRFGRMRKSYNSQKGRKEKVHQVPFPYLFSVFVQRNNAGDATHCTALFIEETFETMPIMYVCMCTFIQLRSKWDVFQLRSQHRSNSAMR